MSAGVLARVVRGGVVESVHYGHLVIIKPDPARHSATLNPSDVDRRISPANGNLRIIFSIGDPFVSIFARSSLKPLQLLASMRCGFSPPDDAALAVAASSHNGEPMHLAAVRRILADAGLTEADLQNTPSLPLDAEAAFQWRLAGRGPQSIAQNCSGKHAAMLAACVASGWVTTSYLNPNHPLQKEVKSVIGHLTEDTEPPVVTVDGCGAPLFSTSLIGLARAFSHLAVAPSGTLEARIADAMREYPEFVGGAGRDVTRAMQAVPGLICKDGAEGVYAGALPDGVAFAFKVLDGSGRPRPTILARVLDLAGAAEVPGADLATLAEIGDVPVLGHGQPVGVIEPAF